MENTGGVVRSLHRGFALLHQIAAEPRPISSARLAGDTGQSKAQVLRNLKALESAELVVRRPDQSGYEMSWSVRGRADQLTRIRLVREGHVALRRLVAATSEAAFIDVLRGDGSVAILEHGSPDSWIGRSFPLYCDDSGQALLFDATREELNAVFARTEFVPLGPNTPTSVDDFESRLNEARTRGYCVVDEESGEGQMSIAAPIRDFTGQIIAAIHILGDRDRIFRHVAAFGGETRQQARAISGSLGWVEGSPR